MTTRKETTTKRKESENPPASTGRFEQRARSIIGDRLRDIDTRITVNYTLSTLESYRDGRIPVSPEELTQDVAEWEQNLREAVENAEAGEVLEEGGVEPKYEQAARVLGASAWQRFRYVTLPLVAPAVISSSLIIFAFIFGAFEVPFILGRTYPAMVSVVAQQRYLDVNLAARPGAVALAVISTLLTAVLAWAYLRLTRALIGLERPFIL